MHENGAPRKKKLEITSLVLGQVATNCYIVSNPQSSEAVVIDPAADAKEIERRLAQEGKTPVAILLTHGHFDHVGAAEALKESYHIPVYAHEAETALAADLKINGGALFGIPGTVQIDRTVRDEDVLTLAENSFRVLHTPGHTVGGVSYYIEDAGVLFSGDTLFAQSVGRTDLPTGDARALLRSVREKLLTLPDGVTVYPGHGPQTTIGAEKRQNPYA